MTSRTKMFFVVNHICCQNQQESITGLSGFSIIQQHQGLDTVWWAWILKWFSGKGPNQDKHTTNSWFHSILLFKHCCPVNILYLRVFRYYSFGSCAPVRLLNIELMLTCTAVKLSPFDLGTYLQSVGRKLSVKHVATGKPAEDNNLGHAVIYFTVYWG